MAPWLSAGGAIYSTCIFWQRRALRHRLISNFLIAGGSVMPAISGVHVRLGGGPVLLYVLELAGVMTILLGFLRSRDVFGLARFPLINGFGRVLSNPTRKP